MHRKTHTHTQAYTKKIHTHTKTHTHIMRGRMMIRYTSLNRSEEVNIPLLFKMRTTTSTRGHSGKLSREQVVYDVKKYFFSNRVVDTWDYLRQDTINTGCISNCNLLFNTIESLRYIKCKNPSTYCKIGNHTHSFPTPSTHTHKHLHNLTHTFMHTSHVNIMCVSKNTVSNMAAEE